MAKEFTVSLEGRSFTAKAGDLLLDAALRNGVELVHDCRVGHCGSCAVELVDGLTLGGDVGCGNVKACQARVFSNIQLSQHDVPHPDQTKGEVESIRVIGRKIVEVSIALRRPLHWLPGQYCKLRFRGYSARSFSPTASLADGSFAEKLVFHIKQVRDGQVTPLLGSEIDVGHRVSVEGPFGHAFFRKGLDNRLVLLGSGTGFAPIWAVTSAALEENPERRIIMICGARNAQSFYMTPALRHAARHGNVTVLAALEDYRRDSSVILPGTPADHMPALELDDIVYAAGAPRMVAEAEALAGERGCLFYADPFEVQSEGRKESRLSGLGQILAGLRPSRRRLDELRE